MTLATDASVSVRFAFGANWADFLDYVEADRIAEATNSVVDLVGPDLTGRRVLDAGSGSGLFSLVAVRLGADHVHSFDLDPESVACTRTLHERFAPDTAWTIERGDLVDVGYVRALGHFELVYCWGVAHHTGAMWAAVDNLCAAVAPGGRLVLSLYNDQGVTSHVWRVVKRVYNLLPSAVRPLYALVAISPYELRSFAAAVARGAPMDYVRSWRKPKRRGMSRWHDTLDWVGGYPFEVARREDVAERCRRNGLLLERLVSVGRSSGCNQFVFRRAIPK